MELPLTEKGRVVGGAGVQKKSRSSILCTLSLRYLLDFQMGVWSRQLEILVRDSRPVM